MAFASTHTFTHTHTRTHARTRTHAHAHTIGAVVRRFDPLFGDVHLPCRAGAGAASVPPLLASQCRHSPAALVSFKSYVVCVSLSLFQELCCVCVCVCVCVCMCVCVCVCVCRARLHTCISGQRQNPKTPTGPPRPMQRRTRRSCEGVAVLCRGVEGCNSHTTKSRGLSKLTICLRVIAP